jgi:RES domain-containing protein
VRFRGRCFRAHDPGWAFAPLSGAGAAQRGGRFNREGKAALYLTLKPETAIAECGQGFAHRMPPITLCDYDVDCEPVADLSTEAGRAAHDVSMAELDCPWLALMLEGKKVPSHEVAERLEAEGYVGALVPSFAPGTRPEDINLVLWRWGVELPILVQVFDPNQRLPKDRRSWQ